MFFQGNTPLHIAFALKDLDMAIFLLTHGGLNYDSKDIISKLRIIIFLADPSILNHNGNRPEECAWARFHQFKIQSNDIYQDLTGMFELVFLS